MDGGTARVAAIAAVLAGAVGAGTAWVMVSAMELPGGPVVADLPGGGGAAPSKEFEELRGKVDGLTRDLAEARLELAAARAFPRGYPPRPPAEPDTSILGEISGEERERFGRYYRAVRAREDAEAAKAIRAAEEAALRQRIERAAEAAPMDEGTRDAAVRVLLEGSDRMRDLWTRAAGGSPEDLSWSRKAEELGQETRRRLSEVLTAAQMKAVEDVLGAAPAPAPKPR
jgi:hypothetical protein